MRHETGSAALRGRHGCRAGARDGYINNVWIKEK